MIYMIKKQTIKEKHLKNFMYFFLKLFPPTLIARWELFLPDKNL